MARKKPHRPPMQSRAPQVPPGQIPILGQQQPQRKLTDEEQRALHEQHIRTNVEQMAASMYLKSFQVDSGDDVSDHTVEAENERIAGQCVDAALAFARVMWNCPAQRQKPPQKPTRAPGVLREETAGEE